MQYVIVGIGGQGILFSTKVLGHIAMSRNEKVMGSEVHGMAQRGGSVISHFKVGDYQSPLVKTGEADILLAFDQNEAIRNLHFLREEGSLLVNIFDEKALENTHLNEYLKKRNIKVFKIKGYDILKEHMGGNFLFLNVLILGALCACDVSTVKIDQVRQAIQQLSPEKFADANLKVLNLGYDAIF
ncbi:MULTISPECIES: 2-oxoacid:acceptor oxidoreductase family protein [Aminobacterium]|jgi:indolepyruvate ferredoxin oxidoreductase beta subunit|uniref:Pyruvate/ketoisovalerate oxidoreductase n=1 Tax=Aminobacterium colombiense (strain DSM 12261 / ALA-1) TaxID=572547 RepID=D5EGG5_AMICL|nr:MULTISPECIES: 2-oxoacid:acceptor oxidoreductase family protein [Aminobacterium]MDD2378513.1 2-oxoacid:acceptor oxidoreductase family protein [Aminobacterium colombiense]ADE57647.1 Pyruvate/ketoisovalerate oxidoreductase [Aminobacterium colombiense DSM 12261]MDD3768673.1 2-oxoacid:acceptor oxidoreductase family protein [Aminobacterium colombiense]MDD4265058.1 2-oxoacid:acceptor oxidoreductase family protein [Aminobacterium colombiense]MDD4586227.1 2-oxoacid:acceptor oxidoreductase family pro